MNGLVLFYRSGNLTRALMKANTLYTFVGFFITTAVVVLGVMPVSNPAMNNITDPALHQTNTDTVEWERPRFDERQDERDRLTDQVERLEIEDPDVLEAMRNVPRHLFVDESQRRQAYENAPLPIGHGQTISQPYIVAYMSEMLEIEPGDKVLEIGTGSGYHAAVLTELTPHVFSVEIIEPLGNQAAERFEELGYHTIETRIGDGYYGWEEYAPFDKIIVTAAPGHIPPPLVEQLSPQGIIAIPIGSAYQTQTLMKVTKTEDGDIRTERMLPVRFVPMTGAAQEE